MPNVSPECKLLTACVGHFYKATCVTHCILEVGLRTNLQHSQSHRVLVVLLRTILLFIDRAATYSKPISVGRVA